MKRQRLTAIITHVRPHLEELLSIFLFLSEHFAEPVKNIFSYVRYTKVLFWDDLPEGTTREELEGKGYVFVGTGGGKRDEHSTSSEPRKEGESAVTLVAKELGVYREAKIQKLLEWTSNRDLNLGESMYELPAVLKMMNDFNVESGVIWGWAVTAFEALYERGNEHFGAIDPDAGTLWNKIANEWLINRFSGKLSLKELDVATSGAANAELFWLRKMPALKGILTFAQKVGAKACGNPFEPHAIAATIQAHPQFGYTVARQWGFATLDILYRQSRDFNEIAAKDFKQAQKRTVELIDGRKISVVIADSDSLEFSRYARSSFGCKAGVVLTRNSAGNVAITSNTQLKLDFSSVVEMLRIQELRKKGLPVPSDRALLRGESAIPNCSEWYYFANGRMVLNGSTTKTRPPTALSLATITGIVFAGLGVKGFAAVIPSATAHQQLIPASAMATA
jgi:hypothetical protein